MNTFRGYAEQCGRLGDAWSRQWNWTQRERQTHARTYMAKDTLREARKLLPPLLPPLLRSPMPFFDMVHPLTPLRVSKLT